MTTTGDAARVRGRMWFLRPQLFDRGTIVVTVLAAVTEATLIPMGESKGGFVGLLVTLLGVAIARRWRWLGLAVVVAGPLLDTALGFQPIVPWTIAVFTAFSVTVRGLPALWVGVLVGGAVYFSVMLADGRGWVDPVAFAAVGMSFTAAAAGSALRNQSRYWDELEQRAQDAVANREAEANRRVAEERLRIARDLHDVVGHEIAVLNMHLGVAEVNLPEGAVTAKSSLTEARGNVREILQETQRILHVLRSEEADSAEGDALRPAPDQAGIPAMIDRFRSGGLEIVSEIDPPPPEVDPEVDSASFRIVQEALTNAQKHGAGDARVQVTVVDDRILIVVANGKPPRSVATPGRRGLGLVGMRERATSAGGRLEIDDGARTFTVRATLRADGGDVR
ncbi:sensor histidine kinase [Herbiconiux liangxiaofengii]|uniref:sensor histidine kinase n=1 Tax=Herbiconiux liangxiaofengii TaxID=3342795 RepID=UPI0035B8CF27